MNLKKGFRSQRYMNTKKLCVLSLTRLKEKSIRGEYQNFKWKRKIKMALSTSIQIKKKYKSDINL